MNALRFTRIGVIVAVLCIGVGGFTGWLFASEKLSGPTGETTMTTTSVETFDGAWIVDMATDIDLTGFDSLRFDFEAGTLYGSGPCRSFKTTFGPDTQDLVFSPFELGGGLCDEATMITERDFFQSLEFVSRLEIESDGSLAMYNADQIVLRAKPLSE